MNKKSIYLLAVLTALAVVIAIVLGILVGKAQAFDGEVSFSYLNNSTARAWPDGGKDELEGLALVEVGHEIKQVRMFTSIETLVDNLNADDGMHPASARFRIGAEYHFKNGFFLGLEHYCWHQIDGGGRDKQYAEQYSLVKIGARFGKPRLK